MHSLYHRHSRLMLLAALLAACPLAVQGEDDGWLEFEEDVQQQQQQWLVQPEQFEQLVFQNADNPKKQRELFETQLALIIDFINDSCNLSEPQQLKLRLAGEMEIGRFFTRYEEVKAYYLESKPTQNEFNDIWQLIQPLQQSAQAGLFGPDSAVRKITRQTLDERQQKVLKATERQQREYRYRALVLAYVTMLDEKLPLSAPQREGLVELLIEETLPPTSFKRVAQNYIMWQASTIPKEKLQAVVKGPMVEAVAAAFQLGRGYGNYLNNQGIRPYSEDEE